MDDRQRTIVEGAGLEESRLNQDLVDFLRKWGTPILLLIVVVAGLYAGSTMWKQHKERVLNQAYADFHAAAVAGSPDNLVVVAEQNKGRGAVYQLALTEAADSYLESARLGLRPGGSPANAEDRLSAEQVASNLSRAGEIYGLIVTSTRGKAGMALHELNGLYGQAAVAESLGKIDEARALLAQSAEVARKAGFDELARVAEARIATLDEVANPPTLYELSDVRSSNRAAASPLPVNSDLGGSLSPMPTPAQPDPFTSGSGPLAPPATDDEGAPTP
jgi:hypothetical protein